MKEEHFQRCARGGSAKKETRKTPVLFPVNYIAFFVVLSDVLAVLAAKSSKY